MNCFYKRKSCRSNQTHCIANAFTAGDIGQQCCHFHSDEYVEIVGMDLRTTP
jgi:hypothetical protein